MVGADAITIGTIIGALIGVVSLLLKMLVAADKAHIATLERERADLIAKRDLYESLTLRDVPTGPRQQSSV